MLLESESINYLIDIAKDYKEYDTYIYDSKSYGYDYGDKTIYFLEIHTKENKWKLNKSYIRESI